MNTPMPLDAVCSHCSVPFAVAPDKAGQVVCCPHCGEVQRAPGQRDQPVTSEPPAEQAPPAVDNVVLPVPSSKRTAPDRVPPVVEEGWGAVRFGLACCLVSIALVVTGFVTAALLVGGPVPRVTGRSAVLGGALIVGGGLLGLLGRACCLASPRQFGLRWTVAGSLACTALGFALAVLGAAYVVGARGREAGLLVAVYFLGAGLMVLAGEALFLVFLRHLGQALSSSPTAKWATRTGVLLACHVMVSLCATDPLGLDLGTGPTVHPAARVGAGARPRSFGDLDNLLLLGFVVSSAITLGCALGALPDSARSRQGRGAP